MNNLIKLDKICKIYNTGINKVYALKNISFSINEGEFVAIIGKSGSGKSTLMNILGCLDSPTSGEYFLKNQKISSMKEKQLSKIRNNEIGFIFQGFNLIPSMSAIENVELPLIYKQICKHDRKILALNALKKVGLESRIKHTPSQLSGGQQQRVAIARAISASPSIILADEPTGNLDSNSGNEIMKILSNLNRNGKTVILITHDEKIANNSKRIIHIHDGTLM